MEALKMIELLLDTNAFKNKDLIRRLATSKENVKAYASVIVALEHYFHLILKDKAYLWENLKQILHLTILPITENEAKLAAYYSKHFLDHPRGSSYFFFDCLIGATAKIWDLILVTENTKDFNYLPEKLVLTPAEALRLI